MIQVFVGSPHFGMRLLRRCGLAVVLCGWMSAAGAAPLQGPEASSCQEAIHAAEAGARLPPALLGSIGVVESGRYDSLSRRVAPWPWTINVEGTGFFFESRDEAIGAVQSALLAGHHSIDVGCMQINLQQHPGAFSSLEEAFDPHSNAVYAAGFLKQLYGQTQDWGNAAAAYHSQTPGMADDYRRRVVAGWSGAALYGVTQWPIAGATRSKHEAYGGYTPEFKARLAQDEADGRALRVAMGLLPAVRSKTPIIASGLRSTLRLSLRD